MMKKLIVLSTAVTLLFCLCACTTEQSEDQGAEESQAPTWQEQYDLGVRYLSEGNYQEAIIAFTAAIEIDPKQAPAYVGRGDAYVLSGETEENLTAAKADYEKAIELDETSAEAYLGLADVYIRQGEYEKALEVLREGLAKAGYDSKLESKIAEIEYDNIHNEYGAIEFTCRSDYRDFGDMSSEEQALIELAVNATLAQNTDMLFTLLNQGNSSPFLNPNVHPYGLSNAWLVCTIWNDYKVELLWGHSNEDTTFWNERIEIELRPENGMGVYTTLQTYSNEMNEDYYRIERHSCSCENWQWNGTSFYSRTFFYENGREVSCKETGMLVNNLREGLFSGINTDSDIDAGNYNYTSLYQNGTLVERDGALVEEPLICGIGSYMYATVVPEEFFW